jgi:transcriptional regulator with XRE-family HTH domain
MMHDLPRIVRELRGPDTQMEFAAKLGRTQTAVSYWESGRRVPALDDLADMLRVAGREWADIFGAGDTLAAYRAGFAAGVNAARKALDGIALPEQDQPS